MSARGWRWVPFELRLRHTFRTHTTTSDTRATLYVALHRDGVIGCGEGAPAAVYGESIEGSMRAVDDYLQRVEIPAPGASLDQIRAPDLPDHRSVQMAVDVALHDWLAKVRRAPLHELLGVSLTSAPSTSFTLGIDDPAVLPARIAEGSSFSCYKVKLGGPEDTEALRTVRLATPKPIRVDANEGWTPETAPARIDRCVEAGVELIEQPLPRGHLEETARLRERSPLPLFADEDFHSEEDAARLQGAYDGVNVKLAKCGGIGPALRAIAAARAAGLEVMLGCMVESSLAIAAALQIAPLVDFTDLDAPALIANDPIAGLRLEEGRFLPGPGNGLGVTPRQHDLARALVGP